MMTTDLPENIRIEIGGQSYRGSHININGQMVEVQRIAALAERDRVEPLTLAERSSIYYYGTNRDDVTRWLGWDAVVPKVEREYPRLLIAIERRAKAEVILQQELERLKPDHL